MRKIILAAGGTGGHFFSAQALGEILHNKGYQVHLITDYRCKKYITSDIKFKVHVYNLKSSKSNILGKLVFYKRLMISILRSIFIIAKIKPDISIGFGGYPSFPIIFASKMFNIPIIVYEQNCFIGKTNQYFLNIAKVIALTYQDTINLPSTYKHKAVVVGHIARSNIRRINPDKQKKSSDPKSNFNILIFGGSQGAKFFSELIPEAVSLLIKNKITQPISILQQARSEDIVRLKNQYKNLDVSYKISDFIYDIDKEYQAADLVICRSGASTIAEITHLKIPAIFIPYPWSTHNHQLDNARALSKDSGYWYFTQDDPDILQKISDLMLQLIQNPKLLSVKRNADKLTKNGEILLADTIEKIINK
ncbi:MAG: undecaprenyldiphospho-muramoylpentapeptide beta-N-acetylglucosaminyltransferase [Rickettsiaceae bacterium]